MTDTSTGKLTTHILDTANGCPARGVLVRLYKVAANGNRGELLMETATNNDGRCDKPLLSDGKLEKGKYCLQFNIGDYFETKGAKLPETRFLDVVSLEFGIDNPNAHYHVPLLASPWAYQTYRGS